MDIVRGLLRSVSPLPDGDATDRISYCYTTVMLVVLSSFITGWSFVGSPIQCWFPAYYKGWWIEYALDYCFVQNTYFVPFTDIVPDNYWDIAEHIIPIPKNITEREDRLIGYYQWVPIILILQALLFYIPVAIWRVLYTSTGIKVNVICNTCNIRSNMIAEDRNKNLEKVASFLADENIVRNGIGGRVQNFSTGRFLITSYLLTKLMYALNALMQFLLLKKILGVASIWWGAQVFDNLINGIEWQQSGNFPRVTLCDFSVRVLGNLHRHTVQCVLMINMFNEKIFVFLWFWLLFIAAASTMSLFYWLMTSFTNDTGRQLVNSYLDKINPKSLGSARRSALVDEFVVEKLRADGVFLLRLVRSNSGDIVTCDLVATLWRRFIAQRTNPPPYTEPLIASSHKDRTSESDL